jgi:hypothetical protein
MQRAAGGCLAGGEGLGTLLEGDPRKMRLGQSGAQTRSKELTHRFFDAGGWERLFAEG